MHTQRWLGEEEHLAEFVEAVVVSLCLGLPPQGDKRGTGADRCWHVRVGRPSDMS